MFLWIHPLRQPLKSFMQPTQYHNSHHQYHFITHKSTNPKSTLHVLKAFIIKICLKTIRIKSKIPGQMYCIEKCQIIAEMYRLWMLIEFKWFLKWTLYPKTKICRSMTLWDGKTSMKTWKPNILSFWILFRAIPILKIHGFWKSKISCWGRK